jgi:predicted secreted hydrolase
MKSDPLFIDPSRLGSIGWTLVRSAIAATALLASVIGRGESGVTADGFALPIPGKDFVFPRDHGRHPEFKIEWWYLTGHLYAADTPARRFGFQATFFRQAGPRTGGTGDIAPEFNTSQLFLAHMALIDVQTGRFLHQERLNRSGWDAHAATETLNVQNGDWSLRLTEASERDPLPTLQLVGGVRAEAAFSLSLKSSKPLVVFGENGVSKKGSGETAASYYLTFTRLKAEGELVLQSERTTEKLRVTGEAWMDHEISSSQLGEGQVGWDWLSIQFTDQR